MELCTLAILCESKVRKCLAVARYLSPKALLARSTFAPRHSILRHAKPHSSRPMPYRYNKFHLLHPILFAELTLRHILYLVLLLSDVPCRLQFPCLSTSTDDGGGDGDVNILQCPCSSHCSFQPYFDFYSGHSPGFQSAQSLRISCLLMYRRVHQNWVLST